MANISDENAMALILIMEAVNTWMATTKHKEAAKELARIVAPLARNRIAGAN